MLELKMYSTIYMFTHIDLSAEGAIYGRRQKMHILGDHPLAIVKSFSLFLSCHMVNYFHKF